MILNWRADWKQGHFPFYYVQLAPYQRAANKLSESNWAELREAQTMTLKLKNTGMAVITDLGSEYDIHPTPKRPVGDRLALAARAQTYGEKIAYSGPIFKKVQFEGGKAILTFDHTGSGLVSRALAPTLERKTKDGKSLGFAWRLQDEPKEEPGKVHSRPVLMGFTICGKDRVFHKADAWIEGETVVVNAPKVVDEPIAVRYGWANHPICNLYNRAGLPASPFRTDTFPGVTQPKNQ
jgi:sialate O-acetylesterase